MTIYASNLTIATQYYGCNKDCPYCISKMTGNYNNDWLTFKRNIPKVRKIAEAAKVYNILITGKGEPLLNFENREKKLKNRQQLATIIDSFSDYPLEIQTNGINLTEGTVQLLCDVGINVIAVSVDDIEHVFEKKHIYRMIKKIGMVSRVTLNLSNMSIPDPNDINLIDYVHSIFDVCIASDVHQFTLRRLSVPAGKENTNQAKWIEDNASNKNWPILQKIEWMLEDECKKNGTLIRSLNHGVDIYDLYGISVTINRYCIQEQSSNNDLRSLIFLQDGHLYTSWGSEASIII